VKLLSELAKPLPLIARELARNRRRTALTFLGLVISFFLYTSLESILYTLTRLLSQTASEAVLFVRPRDRMGFFRPELPRSYVARVGEIEGVLAASPVRFHFGQGREEGSFAAALGVEADSYRRIRSLEGVTEAEWSAFRASRTAAVVGARLLEMNDWRVGDEVTIRGGGRTPPLAFTVVGDVSEEDRFGGIALVHLSYLEEVFGGEGRATFIQARVAHPEIAGALAHAIDAAFANFSVPTETISEKAHVATVLGSLSDALGALRAIGYLTLLVTVLVVGNSVAMSVRERTVEIGTLRALGFGRGRVMGLVLGESVAVAVVGGLVGAAAAYAVFASGWVHLPEGPGFEFATDWSVVARAALLAVPVGALAAFQPAWSAVRMSITDALRYAD
jgi:putative ABC transport system permease protein